VPIFKNLFERLKVTVLYQIGNFRQYGTA